MAVEIDSFSEKEEQHEEIKEQSCSNEEKLGTVERMQESSEQTREEVEIDPGKVVVNQDSNRQRSMRPERGQYPWSILVEEETPRSTHSLQITPQQWFPLP